MAAWFAWPFATAWSLDLEQRFIGGNAIDVMQRADKKVDPNALAASIGFGGPRSRR